MKASVSPRSGHPSEPAGSRAPPAVLPPLAGTCGLLVLDEDQTRGMKMTAAARSSAAVTEPTSTDDGGQEPPLMMMGHILRVPIRMVGIGGVLIVDLGAVCRCKLQDE